MQKHHFNVFTIGNGLFNRMVCEFMIRYKFHDNNDEFRFRRHRHQFSTNKNVRPLHCIRIVRSVNFFLLSNERLHCAMQTKSRHFKLNQILARKIGIRVILMAQDRIHLCNEPQFFPLSLAAVGAHTQESACGCLMKIRFYVNTLPKKNTRTIYQFSSSSLSTIFISPVFDR